MTIVEIKELIHQQLEIISDDKKLMLSALDYISNLGKSLWPIRAINKRDVAKNIRRNLNIIVPVVCDDMFEYINEENEILSIKDFICEQYHNGDNDEIIKAIRDNFFYGISLLEKSERESLSNAIYKGIEETIELGRIKLKTNVARFLRNGNFPIIITTFGFNLIEKELGLKKESTEWYNPNRRNDLPILNHERPRIVYHIFGGETHSSWVYNEQTLLKFMHSLHSEDYGAKNLSSLLRKHGNEEAKSLLVMGSSLPDWLFRFFVYPMYEDELKDVKGYWLSLDDIEKELDFFLERNNYTGQTNLRNGNRVETILAEATPDEIGHILNQSQKPKIFVSYKREVDNLQKAEEIQRVIDILCRQGVVWLDTQEVSDGGNAYWANIKNAVMNCDIFVPIVTERYIEEYLYAEDVSQITLEGFINADNSNANDSSHITDLKPVLREAFYAIAYGKKCSPIVIYNEKTNLNAGSVEAIAKDKNNPHNLPLCIFGEHTLLLHNDKKPVFFKLPNID